MAQVILDLGSGNTCQNDIEYAKSMIDCVATLDTHKHEVILKWQLEKDDPPGQRKLDRFVFAEAYEYAKKKGYQTTSSVFDKPSLDFLSSFDVPFIKIACRPDLYWLIDDIHCPVYASFYDLPDIVRWPSVTWLRCIPKYPATLKDYDDKFLLLKGEDYSDHTAGLGLWHLASPNIWEKHFVLERDKANPDAGPFAITPKQLKEVL